MLSIALLRAIVCLMTELVTSVSCYFLPVQKALANRLRQLGSLSL
jgi:hypothetical protein